MNEQFAPLYEEILYEHYKKPKYRRILEGQPFIENPSCGDRVRFLIEQGADGRITNAAFDGSGCSVSMSSADILAENLIGKTPKEARTMIEIFLKVLRGELDVDELDALGDAIAFKGIAQLPVRVKCAALAWRAALAQFDQLQNE